ncbi:hypothetical protein BY458DRAFT_507349 [Sporodiniella umbellata]|nr:hypothetical protein BY458DRAFT_507349 [Sporodiniella umbellata]
MSSWFKAKSLWMTEIKNLFHYSRLYQDLKNIIDEQRNQLLHTHCLYPLRTCILISL